MGNGDELKKDAQQDKLIYRWRELSNDGNQKQDDTLTKRVHQ